MFHPGLSGLHHNTISSFLERHRLDGFLGSVAATFHRTFIGVVEQESTIHPNFVRITAEAYIGCTGLIGKDVRNGITHAITFVSTSPVAIQINTTFSVALITFADHIFNKIIFVQFPCFARRLFDTAWHWQLNISSIVSIVGFHLSQCSTIRCIVIGTSTAH
jgi:hypothetical protein